MRLLYPKLLKLSSLRNNGVESTGDSSEKASADDGWFLGAFGSHSYDVTKPSARVHVLSGPDLRYAPAASLTQQYLDLRILHDDKRDVALTKRAKQEEWLQVNFPQW